MPTDRLYRGRHRPSSGRRDPLPVDATDVGLAAGGRTILANIDLSLAPGSFTALTGASGAGKSTLLWILAGVLTPSDGHVRYAGRSLPDPDAAARDGVVLVPQGLALVTALTARENLLVPLVALGLRPDEAETRAALALEQVRLQDVADHLVEELSGGQQQRVAVARGLAVHATVLLADEVTSELDAATRETIVALLAAEAEAGAVVLLATHDAWCADQAEAEYHLDEGRLTRIR